MLPSTSEPSTGRCNVGVGVAQGLDASGTEVVSWKPSGKKVCLPHLRPAFNSIALALPMLHGRRLCLRHRWWGR